MGLVPTILSRGSGMATTNKVISGSNGTESLLISYKYSFCGAGTRACSGLTTPGIPRWDRLSRLIAIWLLAHIWDRNHFGCLGQWLRRNLDRGNVSSGPPWSLSDLYGILLGCVWFGNSFMLVPPLSLGQIPKDGAGKQWLLPLPLGFLRDSFGLPCFSISKWNPWVRLSGGLCCGVFNVQRTPSCPYLFYQTPRRWWKPSGKVWQQW